MHFIIVGQVVQAICETSTSFPFNPNRVIRQPAVRRFVVSLEWDTILTRQTNLMLDTFSMMVFVCILLFDFCFQSKEKNREIRH